MTKKVQTHTLDRIARTEKNLKGRFDVQNVATWDIEAENWTEISCIGVYYPRKDKYYRFDTMKEFTDHALSACHSGTHFWAHNAGRYDTNLLWKDVMDNESYEFNIIDTAGSIIKLSITDTSDDVESNYKWHFHDSLHLLSGSLDDLTYLYNVEHKKQSDFDLDKIKADTSEMSKEDREELFKYLKYDCKGLWEVLQKFNQDIKDLGGSTALTKASTAMKTWRINYFPLDVEGIYNYQDLESYVKQAYFGGRTEVFKRYGEDINAYDINSLYPSQMIKPLPIGNPVYKEDIKDIDSINGVIAAEVEAPEDIDIPILPTKNRIGKSTKLIFPSGRFRGAWDTEELKAAVENGYKIHEIIWAIDFPREYPVFKDYVNRLYQEKTKLKKQGETGARYKTVKVLLNSLYGKTAMHRQQGDIIQHPTEETIRNELKNGAGIKPYNEKLDLWEFNNKTDANYIVPMLAVRITALARLQLWEILNKFSENLYYCDTDSAFLDTELPMNLVDSYDLGKWDLEAEIEEGYFLQAKLYSCLTKDGGVKQGHKGLQANDLTHEKFKKAYKAYKLDGKLDGSYLLSSWTSPGGWRSSMQSKGKPITVEKKDRQPKLNSFKRVWDGNSSVPIRLMYGRPTNLDDEGDPRMFQRGAYQLFKKMAGRVKMDYSSEFYDTYQAAIPPRKQMILGGREKLPEKIDNESSNSNSEDNKSEPNQIYDRIKKDGIRIPDDVELQEYWEEISFGKRMQLKTKDQTLTPDHWADKLGMEDWELMELLIEAESQEQRTSYEEEYEQKLRKRGLEEMEEKNNGKTILEWSNQLEIQTMELIDILKWTNLPEKNLGKQKELV